MLRRSAIDAFLLLLAWRISGSTWSHSFPSFTTKSRRSTNGNLVQVVRDNSMRQASSLVESQCVKSFRENSPTIVYHAFIHAIPTCCASVTRQPFDFLISLSHIGKHFDQIFARARETERDDREWQWFAVLLCLLVAAVVGGDDDEGDNDVLLLSFSVTLVENNSFPLMCSTCFSHLSLLVLISHSRSNRNGKSSHDTPKLRRQDKEQEENANITWKCVRRPSLSLSPCSERNASFWLSLFFLSLYLLDVIGCSIDWLQDRIFVFLCSTPVESWLRKGNRQTATQSFLTLIRLFRHIR